MGPDAQAGHCRDVACRSRSTRAAARETACRVGGRLRPKSEIPDFIPVLGLLDDLLLVPLGIWLVLRLIPSELLAELRLAAGEQKWPGPARNAALLIIGFWLAGLVWLFVELRKRNWLGA